MATEFHVFDLSKWPTVHVSLQRAPLHDGEILDFQKTFCGLLHLAAYGTSDRAPCALKLVMCLDGIVDATPAQQYQASLFIKDVKPLVLAGAQAGEAEAIGRQVMAQVLALRLAHPGSSGSPFITVRVGLAVLTPQDGSAAGLVSRAQEALSVAKEAGGNCLIRL
jgi:hypothetical protein